jgi:hypothetical protein
VLAKWSVSVVTKAAHTYINILPSATLDIGQLVHRHHVAVSEIPCSYLGIDLYSAVGRNHFVGQFDSLVNRDALIDDSIVLHRLSAMEKRDRLNRLRVPYEQAGSLERQKLTFMLHNQLATHSTQSVDTK